MGDQPSDGASGKGGSLFGKMMRSIGAAHTLGNRVRMVKLPLIFTDQRLYAGAIANFYWLTLALEKQLMSVQDDPLVSRVLELGLTGTAKGYEKDLAELLGPDGWEAAAVAARTPSTEAYIVILENSSPVQLVSAAFILYGALVIGGGKMTQAKVQKVFPKCTHVLFDVAEDIQEARSDFRKCFNEMGEEYPEHADELVAEAKKFMDLNNTVVFSIRCLPYWWWQAVAVTTVTAVGVVLARRRILASR